ncbi:ABC transporter ATP-binding protein [Paracoccus sp. P2]|uniref:ABC transporter ATP-binding protein n=1 Tax=Paracoccus TaxID=265 RepID=UPI000E095130|nr:ABC transporter ATP-binding protein [Paracoccus pantotrophus]RDD97554.1 ABC transporter ATP-binding protein [Paracoccus pantotrophus]WGR67678.1 ABC transporter ATP-binding protein [Paracoccus pantotrophus]
MAFDQSPQGPDIVVSGLDKVFGHGETAVHAITNANLSLERGEFLSLLGPSGCGKTTLLRIIAGLEAPTSGNVQIRDRQVWASGRRSSGATRPVSMMFQEARLFPWYTVAENVALPLRIAGTGRAERMARARRICETVGLGAFVDHRPGQLSGGMRQRASLARALVTEPQVLLLDEPFGALDAMTRDTLNLELMEVCARAKVTTILVTHSITEAAFLSDRVVVLAPRPARIVETIEMPFPRPRDLDLQRTSGFQNMVGRLRKVLTEGAA